MISALAKFDNITAAGILARAALAITDNPAGEIQLPGEASIREAVISEALLAHGLNPQDQTPQALERLEEILDSERESLVQAATRPALERLSIRGDLPSDLFDIELVRDISDFHGPKFRAEEKLIAETVRSPDREQHYGPPLAPGQPFLISLFAKQFPSQYPAKTFTMLVVGQRQGLKLVIHQAWRIYPSEVSLENTTTLVDLLQRFSDNFGIEIELGGKRGRFILAADLPKSDSLSVSWRALSGEPQKIGKRQRRKITLSCFTQKRPNGTIQAALAVAIDLNKYSRLLEAMR